MEFDYKNLDAQQRYKLLVNCLVPRPIALVSTVSPDGRYNVAPFSFFNAVSDDPPALAVGVNSDVAGRTKDTAQNIRDTAEFVVNLVDQRIAEKMNICGVNFPPETNEFTASGLTPVAGIAVRAPRVLESPISFECRRLVNVEIGVGRNVVIGEVVYLHVRDDLVDMENLHIHTHQADIIARMHGRGWYARTSDLFEMPRATI